MVSTLPRTQDQQGVGHTYDLWKGFPREEIFVFKDRNVGYGVCDHFTSFDKAPTADDSTTAQYASNGARIYMDASSDVYQITGGQGGGLRIFNTADNEEAWVQYGGATGAPFVISDTAAYARELVFECSFASSTTTVTKVGWFLGLMEQGCAAANTIADAGTMAAKDFIGLFKPEGNTTEVDLIYSLNGQTMVTHVDGWKDIVAGTFYKFGFRFNPSLLQVTFWWGTGDGSTTLMEPDTSNRIVAADIASTTDYFPDGEEMSPILGGKNAHADDAYLDVRFLECAQSA